MDSTNASDALSSEQITEALKLLNVAWSAIPGEGLVRVWDTTSFKQGFALAQKIGDLAVQYEVEPTVLINGEMVQMVLDNREAGGVSAREVALAQAIDKLLH